MTAISFPTLSRAAPTDGRFGSMANTQEFTSPLNRTTQTLALPGELWVATVNFAVLTAADRRTLAAFLVGLAGRAGRFYYSDPLYRRQGPAGSAVGVPVIDDQIATSGGKVLHTAGWTAPQTGVLLAGDYVAYDVSGYRQMHIVTADADAADNGPALGYSALSVAPAIRRVPPAGTPLLVATAACVMQVADDAAAQWAIRNDALADFTLEMIEALPA